MLKNIKYAQKNGKYREKRQDEYVFLRYKRLKIKKERKTLILSGGCVPKKMGMIA
jgi:hypothetical protein